MEVEDKKVILKDASFNGMNGNGNIEFKDEPLDIKSEISALNGDMKPLDIEMDFKEEPIDVKSDFTQIISLADGTDIRLDLLEEHPQKPVLTKVLRREEIQDALDQSLDPNDEDYQESEDGSEDEDISGEEASKRPRLDEDDGNLRKSGRERKIPKKFDTPPQTNKRSHKKKDVTEESDEDESDTKKRKRGREKNPPKPKPVAKPSNDASPKKAVRKKKKQIDKKKNEDDSDGSADEIVSKSFKKRLKQKSKVCYKRLEVILRAKPDLRRFP